MRITSRFGCPVKDLTWKHYQDGTASTEVVLATRIEDNKRKEYSIFDLRAKGGLKAIISSIT